MGAKVRRVDDKTVVIIDRHTDAWQWREPRRRILAAHAAQGNVRQGLGHAITVPNGIAKMPKFFLQIGIERASTNDDVPNLP